MSARLARALLAAGVFAAVFPGATVGPRAAVARAAEPSAVAPRTVEQGVLAAELAADGLWLAVCAEEPCAPRRGQRVEVPSEVLTARAGARFERVELEGARELLHLRVPLDGGDFEALLAARPGAAEPLVVFAGRTGPIAGVDGERRGEVIRIVQRRYGRRVLIGEVRQDVTLCGRPTLLSPRLLTPAALALEPATLQRLSAEERRRAPTLRAERTAPPKAAEPPGAARTPEPGSAPAEASTPAGGSAAPSSLDNPLRVLAASSANGDPRALVDGDPSTRWSEARGGGGRGEFVVLRAAAERPLVGFDLLVMPARGAPPRAAAPRALWIATRSELYRAVWAEDAAGHPGAWYRVTLPSPTRTDCVAFVLEEAFGEAADAEVGLSEIRGRVLPHELAPERAAALLDREGKEGDDALVALLQAGDEGVRATLAAFSGQGELGRRRSLDVLERAPCAEVADAFVSLLGDRALGGRAVRRLRQCGRDASDALAARLERDPAAAPLILDVLARVDAARSVPLIVAALATARGAEREALRDALSGAAKSTEARAPIAQALADATQPPRTTLAVLRLLGDTIVEYQPEAGAALARVARGTPGFAERYLALAPAGRLALVDPRAAEVVRAGLGSSDPHLRAEAARVASGAPSIESLVAATRDPEVRVRAAAVTRLGELAAAVGEPALVARIEADRWPLVRAAAATALGRTGRSPRASSALVAALEDDAPSVRRAAVRALGEQGAAEHTGVVAERFQDDEEDPFVREAAAATLGRLCAHDVVDALTRAALKLGEPGRAEEELGLGRAALAALGRLAPADLPQRIEPLRRAKIAALLAPMLDSALHDTERCTKATPSAPVSPKP